MNSKFERLKHMTEASPSELPSDFDASFAYHNMVRVAERLHNFCRRAIRSGYISLLVLPAILGIILKMTGTDKVFILVVWIICMFVLAAILLLIAFVDNELQRALDEIHVDEKFGPLMSVERSEILKRLRSEHHAQTIWHVKKEELSEK